MGIAPEDGGRAGEEPAAAAQLYGRRKGKKLRPHQAWLMQELLPRLTIDVSRPIADLAAEFAARPAEIWLEIGFGGGEHLIAEALAHPQAGFLGCEPFVNGVAKLLTQIEAAGCSNLRLFEGDAALLIGQAIDRLPENEAKLLDEFHFQRRKVAQLAESYGISERAIEGRLRRARERLRRELDLIQPRGETR